MTISAKVIAASASAGVPTLVTMELRYPRFIHAEFMTHRVFSRNASSSRAVPVKKMIQDVIDDPAMPVRWGANQPGMQDAGDHDAPVYAGFTTLDGRYEWQNMSPRDAWLMARDRAVEAAQNFSKAGYHKQVVNRLLEPFAHITVIVTATDWQNFFDLRCHPAADPTMRALAEAMRDAYDGKVSMLYKNDWHLPYIVMEDVRWVSRQWEENPGASEVDLLAMISAARCARVSYLNHDGSAPDIEKDLALAQRLLADRHMSPFEHQATPDARNHQFGWEQPKMHGNLVGWIQWRKHLEKNL